ncbi:biopolymer transporter ExbD [Methylobacillus sp. MM3]|uniref:ExbD/TolR family protein n=1 Tax=Methylobacillus sp. MM3 TaxID=1848039 RepID=UPI0007DEEDC9|nr:biopolymer transporter ExbD [Methylobacillus sp. MM3]OAJ71299.1 biopolymer transporter ExbD [Methylobacillus sp. MM3]
MAFGGFSKSQTTQPMAEINMIPLIDVMLVLLVIFIITAPMLTHAVKVELPKASSTPEEQKPEVIRLTIDAAGMVYWNDQKLEKSDWQMRMAEAAKAPTQPELRIRADGGSAYRNVAVVMSDAASAGLTKIGFVTDPNDNR